MDDFDYTPPESLSILLAGLRQARLSEIERGLAPARWTEVRKVLAAMGYEPVLLAVAAATGPLARTGKFRYTEPPCSAD